MSEQAPPGFLGTGWSFPPAFGRGGAEVATVEGVDDVHQALAILFATRPGERPMQESFGCSLDDVMFEEIDHALVNRVSTMISDAMLAFETRVQLLNVDVSQDPDEAGLLIIRIDYAILGTNSRYNMVFPFYLNEASAPGT